MSITYETSVEAVWLVADLNNSVPEFHVEVPRIQIIFPAGCTVPVTGGNAWNQFAHFQSIYNTHIKNAIPAVMVWYLGGPELSPCVKLRENTVLQLLAGYAMTTMALPSYMRKKSLISWSHFIFVAYFYNPPDLNSNGNAESHHHRITLMPFSERVTATQRKYWHGR